MIIKSFNAQTWKFITFRNNKVSWTKNIKKSGICFSCNDVINLVDWLIDNTYVTIGDKVFKQCIGIPMGTDCAPYLANLFSYAYEFTFLKDTLKQKDFNTQLKGYVKESGRI